MKRGRMDGIGDRSVVLERERAIAESRFHRANRTILAEVVKSIKDGQGQILEIGCGHGDVTRDYLSSELRKGHCHRHR